MKLSFLATREMSSRPGAVMRRLHREGALIVTDHGKPRALMLPVDEDTLMHDIADLIGRRAGRALEGIRDRSVASGLEKLGATDIDAEISAVRRLRKDRA